MDPRFDAIKNNKMYSYAQGAPWCVDSPQRLTSPARPPPTFASEVFELPLREHAFDPSVLLKTN